MTLIIDDSNSGSRVGFNPNEVKKSINDINGAYAQLMRALTTDMQNKFVDFVKMHWKAPNAVTFFTTAFEPSMSSLIDGVNKIFESVVASMNDAASNWARAFNAENRYTQINFVRNTSKIDVSGISSENSDGSIIIDTNDILDTALGEKLPEIGESVNDALDAAKQAVSNSGFIGGDQASTLNTSLEQIRTNILTAFYDIKAGVNSYIGTTTDDVSKVAVKVSDAFRGSTK